MNKYLKVLSNPRIYYKQLLEELYDEYLTLTKQVSYDHYLIFIAGLPKSGTTWLEKLISEILGYIQLDGSFLRTLRGVENLEHKHGINQEMINSAPKKKYSFLKLHTHCDEEYIQILKDAEVKPTILIRDIRDMMISRYWHILSEPTHWQYNEIMNLPFNEGFEKSLFGIFKGEPVIHYFLQWINNWIEYINKNPNDTMLIKYEEMKNDLISTLTKLFYFYGIQYSKKEIKNIILIQNNKHINKENLSSNLKLLGREITTFRKGEPGEWKNYFNKSHCRIFKELAGKTLIISGYEKNLDW